MSYVVESYPEADAYLSAIASGRPLFYGESPARPSNALVARRLDCIGEEGFFWFATDPAGRVVPMNWGYVYVRPEVRVR